jgi:flagellar secretion chaperone FliS
MYAPHRFAAPAAVRTPQAAMYSRVGVETGVADASPHKLVAMLFDGFFESIARAKAALASAQTEAKCREIGRAARIVEEGLKASLDLRAGGALAADLADLYAYITMRLTQANLRNDAAALDECRALMLPLQQAWTSIAARADAADTMARR